MKKVFFCIIGSVCVIQSGFSQEFKFKELKLNFGFVHEGDTVKLQYEFENVGKLPLIITDYKVECNCTVMEKPAKPIMPNEKSILIVKFDTANKFDRQDRIVTVISNAINSPIDLRFKGVVLQPKKKN